MQRKWRLRCPKCGYYFSRGAIKKPELERCPMPWCSYQGKFEEFVEYEIEPDQHTPKHHQNAQNQ